MALPMTTGSMRCELRTQCTARHLNRPRRIAVGVLGYPITIEIGLALGYLAPRIDFDVST
jgi:hypothetical protein